MLNEAITIVYRKGVKGRKDRRVKILFDRNLETVNVINLKSGKDISHKFDIQAPFIFKV
jgi:hypothetical protein